jgi:hypothetical protein
MFRKLLAHLQEALHKRHLVYCVRVMSVGSTWCSRLTEHARNIPSDACEAITEDEQVKLENMWRPLILNKLNESVITSVSLYWCIIYSFIFCF